MKNLILASALVLSGMTASASAESAEQLCPAIGNLAANIMKARQSSASISDVMSRMRVESENGNNIIMAMITDAYRVPRYGSAEYVGLAVSDFRNRAELACYAAFGIGS
jgi:hypothetical protein